MKRVHRVTGTVRAYFISDETDLDRLVKIGREVIDETIEYYGSLDSISVVLSSVSDVADVPATDRGKYVFARSDEYVEDTDITVEDAIRDA